MTNNNIYNIIKLMIGGYMKDKKNILIGALVFVIAMMAVGYAALSANLTVNGTSSSGNATWNIDFKSINILL